MADTPGKTIIYVSHTVYSSKSINYVNNMRNAVVSPEAKDIMRRHHALKGLLVDEKKPFNKHDIHDASGTLTHKASESHNGTDYGGWGARDLTYGDVMHHLLTNVSAGNRTTPLNLLETMGKIDNVEINISLYREGLKKMEAAIGIESF